MVVYSHGFGVRKDDRGLFTDIANTIPEVRHVMFDYNLIDEQANVLTVSPLQIQAQKLNNQLREIEDDSIIDIVAHSQGCVTAALAQPKGVRRIFFLAPPDNVEVDRLINIFGEREGSVIDLGGESRIPRRDNSTTIIPAAYWQGLADIDPMQLYGNLLQLTDVRFFVAKDDEVLGATDFSRISEHFKLIQLQSSHDFTGKAREYVADYIRHEIVGS